MGSQPDKRNGDYSAEAVAKELTALFDAIGLERFSLVAHDWGSIIGDHVASMVPHRIIKYICRESPVLKTDAKKHPQFIIAREQDVA